MSFGEYLDRTLAFIITNIGEIVDLFVNTARHEGPGAVILERTRTRTRNSMGPPKNELHWQPATEIQYLYGESYSETISSYTPGSKEVYLIIAQTDESGYQANVIGALYRIHRETYDLTLIEPKERRFVRTMPRPHPMLKTLTRDLMARN